jgi:outer membrane receptor protein involved in Fe transport
MHNVWGKPFGLDTLYADNPQRLPNNSLSGWSYQGKIDYDFNPNVKLSLTGNGSVDNWREYRQEWALNSDHGPRYEDKNLGLNAKITHTLNANTFYNLSASYFKTSRLRGDGVVFDDYEAYERKYEWGDGEIDDVVNPEYDDFDMFWVPSEEITVISDPDTTIDGTDTLITRDTVVLDEASYYAGYLDRRASYIGFKGDLNSQVNDNHTIKTGFDFQYHTLRYFRNLDATKGFQETRVNRYGFDEVGNTADPDGFMNDTKHPINLGLYVQDRFEWKGMVVNAGLRFDYFDYRAKRVIDPVNPFKEEDLTKLDEADLENTEKFSRVSPRLGISFPVSPKTQMYINYGKFYQRPDLDKLYVGYDFWEARVTAGSYFPFASPNLEPEKTTQYEVGITQQLGDNVALTIGAYYKDVEDLTQIETFIEVDPSIRSYSVFDNIDYGTIKGVDIALNMRRTRHLRLDLKYTLSYATGTGSYAQSAYVINWSNPKNPIKTTHPLDYDQRHNLTGVFDWQWGAKEGPKLGETFLLENTSLNVLMYALSGTPYTPTYPYDEATESAVRPDPRGPINSARKPWNFSIDLQFERAFTVGNFTLKPYVMVRNLLDWENEIGVYESTGEPDQTGFLNTEAGQTNVQNAIADGTDYIERYELKQHNATNYSIPRMVWFGLRVSF